MSTPEDMPSAGNSPIFVGIPPVPSETGFVSIASNRYKSLWMFRDYFLIMNDGNPANGWDAGYPNQYPPSWSILGNSRVAYAGNRGMSPNGFGVVPFVWETPEAYQTKFIDSFGSNIQAGQGVTSNPLSGVPHWAEAGYDGDFNVAPNSNPQIVYPQPPENNYIGGYLFIGIGDLRSEEWHNKCLADSRANPASYSPNPFVRKRPVKIDEDMTYYTGSGYGSTAYMDSVNALPQDDPDLKMLAFAYGRVAYTTICTSFSQNLDHNPQDGITVKMEIVVERAAQFLVNTRVEETIDSSFGLKKKFRSNDTEQPPYIDPVSTVVTYTFSKTDNTDDAGAAVFGQRVHYSQPLELGKIVRYNKQKYDEGIIPPWTEKEAYMKVLSVYPTMIYGRILEVSTKPFYYLT